MIFMKNHVSNLREKQGKTDYFVPALAILTGVLASFFLVKSGFSSIFICSEPVAFLLIASAVSLLFSALSGLHLFGFFLIVILNLIIGGLLMLLSLMADGGSIFVLFPLFFAASFFSLLISAASYSFSKKLFSRVCSEPKLRHKLIKFSALMLGVILVIFSALFFTFKFNPELFI